MEYLKSMFEYYLEKLDWKILAGILFGIGVVLIIFLIISLFASPKSPRTGTISPTPAASDTTPALSQFQNPNKSTYTGSFFAITIPQGWNIVESQIAGGGSSAEIRKQIAISQKPVVGIQMYPETVVPITRLESIFTIYGFTKKTLVVNGTVADAYSGIKGQGAKTVHEMAVFFKAEVGNTVQTVKIDASYAGPTDSGLEDTMNQIVTSVRILR